MLLGLSWEPCWCGGIVAGPWRKCQCPIPKQQVGCLPMLTTVMLDHIQMAKHPIVEHHSTMVSCCWTMDEFWFQPNLDLRLWLTFSFSRLVNHSTPCLIHLVNACTVLYLDLVGTDSKTQCETISDTYGDQTTVPSFKIKREQNFGRFIFLQYWVSLLPFCTAALGSVGSRSSAASLTLSLTSLKSTFPQPFKEKCISAVVRIDNKYNYLSFE